MYLAVVGGGPSDVHPVAPGVVELRQPHEPKHLQAQAHPSSSQPSPSPPIHPMAPATGGRKKSGGASSCPVSRGRERKGEACSRSRGNVVCTLSRPRPLTIAVGNRAATPRTASRICNHQSTEYVSQRTGCFREATKQAARAEHALLFRPSQPRRLTSSVMTALSGSSTIGDSVPS